MVIRHVFAVALPDSPIRKSSYASQVTTPPGSLLQHHFMILQSVWLRQRMNRCGETGMLAYQWLGEPQFLCQPLACVLPCALVGGFEEVAYEVAGGTRVGGGAEGEEHEGHVQGCRVLAVRAGCQWTCRRTPRFHLLGADVDELLDLVGRDILARP